MAAIYILRLWAHCQERKSDTFVMPPAGLKAQCKCPAPADAFEKALIDAGFLVRDGASITVVGWAEKNASLIAAWENGSKGGRPKKNQNETHGKPTGNPAVTHGQPDANPGETDKRREEKNSPSLRSGEVRASRLPTDWVLPVEWRDWAEQARPDIDVRAVASQFRDHWIAKPGKDGRKLDWQATWRNWVRNQHASRGPPRGPAPTAAEQRAMQAVPSIAAPHLRPQTQPLQFVEEVANEPPIALG